MTHFKHLCRGCDSELEYDCAFCESCNDEMPTYEYPLSVEEEYERAPMTSYGMGFEREACGLVHLGEGYGR